MRCQIVIEFLAALNLTVIGKDKAIFILFFLVNALSVWIQLENLMYYT